MNIFIGKLPPSVNAEDLRKAFAGFGSVLNVRVATDPANGRPLGFGNVYVVPDAAALDAIEELNFMPLKGQPVALREYVLRAGRERRMARLASWTGNDRRRKNERRHRPTMERPSIG